MKRSILIVVLAALLLTACGAAATQMVTDSRDAGYVEPQMGYGGGGAPAEMPVGAPEANKAADSTVANAPGAPQERLVLKSSDLSIVVVDPQAKMDSVIAMAERMGGFVVSMNLYQNYAPDGTKVAEVTLVIRVPEDKLQDALDGIKEGVGEVLNETRSGDDVTAVYTDLKSRLKNYEVAEQQLQEIMDKATDPEQVVYVFNQMVYYREQIELVKGQMKYYEEAAALSSISLRIVAEKTVQPIEIGGWKPEGTVRDAIQDLLYFLQNFVDFLIWLTLNFLIKLLVVALVFGTPLWLIGRGIRKSWQKRKAAQTPPPAA